MKEKRFWELFYEKRPEEKPKPKPRTFKYVVDEYNELLIDLIATKLGITAEEKNDLKWSIRKSD